MTGVKVIDLLMICLNISLKFPNGTIIFNDILHMSFLAGTHVFKAFPAYTTTEL